MVNPFIPIIAILTTIFVIFIIYDMIKMYNSISTTIDMETLSKRFNMRFIFFAICGLFIFIFERILSTQLLQLQVISTNRLTITYLRILIFSSLLVIFIYIYIYFSGIKKSTALLDK